MKNVKFTLIFLFSISTILLCVKSVQGQGFPPQPSENPPECDHHPTMSINISLDGNGVNIDVLDTQADDTPSGCRLTGGVLYLMTKIDSRPNGDLGGYFNGFNIKVRQPGQVFYSVPAKYDLPPGEYYYKAIVWRPDRNYTYEFTSEEFTVEATSYDMVWTDKLGVSQNDTRLTRNINTGGNCTSGAASVNTIPSGEDGWVEMTVTENWSTKFFGLSNSNPDACRWTIGHSVYFQNQKLHIYEGGQYVGLYGSCAVGDVIRVERIGTTIYYKKNGVEFYKSAKPSSGSLIADVTITDRNGTIGDSRCSHPVFDGLKVGNDSGNVKVYPNPAKPKGNLRLEFDFHADKDATLAIHNINGQLIHEETMSVQKGKNSVNVFLDNYTPGMYLLKIQAGTHILSHKLIVQ